MSARAAQIAVFAVAILSFALPFAGVRCGVPSGTVETPSVPPDEAVEFHGYELALGSDIDGALAEIARGFVVPTEHLRVPAEPTALLGALAAVVGLALSLTRRYWREGGLVAGIVGFVSLILLGMSPLLRGLGLFRVSWKVGYWSCLVLFGVAAGIAFFSKRRSETALIPTRAEGPSSGRSSAIRRP